MRSLSVQPALIASVFTLGLSACYTGIDTTDYGGFADEVGFDTGLDTGTDESGSGADTTGMTTDGGTDGTTTDGTTTDGTTTDGTTTDGTTTDGTTTDGTTTDGTTTTGGTTTGGAMGGDMPDNPYCNPVDNWDPQWVAWELEVIDLVNEARAMGGNCGAQGNFPPSGPLTWHAALTCASRVHSKDMGDKNYFSHTNLEGNGPGWRMGQAGYGGGGWGENIAAGYGSPAQAVQGWLDSDGHCANMLNPSFSLTGVGYAYAQGSDYGHYWTQTFGN